MTNDGARSARKGLSIVFIPLALLFDHAGIGLRGPATFLFNKIAGSRTMGWAFEEAVAIGWDGTRRTAVGRDRAVSSKE
jgi:hypothetical protein